MDYFDQVLVSQLKQGSGTLHMPEVLSLELYTSRKGGMPILSLLKEVYREKESLPAYIIDPCRSFLCLDGYFESKIPSIKGLPSRGKYKALPKKNRLQRLVAEVYRILRAYYTILSHPKGQATEEKKRFFFDLADDPLVYSFRITSLGLELLGSFVSYYLSSLETSLPEAYVEAMLGSYYSDIADQIRDFHDEDENILLFHSFFRLNRHFRYANGNSEFTVNDGHLKFRVDAQYENNGIYPIDFYFQYDRILHIVPVEVLENWRLPVSELSKWQVKGENEK